jgi:hypothetical protein
MVFRKTQALSYQKKEEKTGSKRMWSCGRKQTHTHSSNYSYEHPPRSEFELVVSSNAHT